MEPSILDQLDEFRLNMSTISNSLKVLEKAEGRSREVAAAFTASQCAKMWLGAIKGCFGSDSPYPKDGTRKTIKDIEKEDGKSEKTIPYPNKKRTEEATIQYIDSIREELKHGTSAFVTLIAKVPNNGTNGEKFELNSSASEVYRKMRDTRFWLGMLLRTIRDGKK